ncbi:MAG: hypothetical protein MHM6MM_008064 [Cercozoa sp. M6MM]
MLLKQISGLLERYFQVPKNACVAVLTPAQLQQVVTHAESVMRNALLAEEDSEKAEDVAVDLSTAAIGRICYVTLVRASTAPVRQATGEEHAIFELDSPDRDAGAEGELLSSVALYCPNGYASAFLNNTFWERSIKGSKATTRNIRTMRRVLELVTLESAATTAA